MEIKNCAHCGGEAMLWNRDRAAYQYLVRCTICRVRTDYYREKESCIDTWNSREEQLSEADRWFNEATEQLARADMLQMQVDELSEALNQARRIMAYAGKLQ